MKKILAIAILMLVSVPILWSYYHARKFIASWPTERVRITEKDIELSKTPLGNFENVVLKTSDQVNLKGWYKQSANGKMVIFVHGGFGNRLQFIEEAKTLAKNGMGFLMYDSRNSGESDTSIFSWGDHEQQDLKSAIDFVVNEKKVIPGCLGAMGFSVGASTVAMTASYDKRISAVALNAVWSSLKNEVANKLTGYRPFTAIVTDYEMNRRGINIDNVNPIKVIKKISPRPILFIAGTKDADTPVEIVRSIYDVALKPKYFLIIKNAHHGDDSKIGKDIYLNKVSAFFSNNLCQIN